MKALNSIEFFDYELAPYWTQQRRELRQWFAERAPSFEEGYVAAVCLLHMPPFPARMHLICHLVRDIYRNLPAALGLKLTAKPADVFPNMVKDLTEKWRKFPPTMDIVPQIASDCIVSAKVYRCMKKLVDKSMKMREQPTNGEQLAIALFRSTGCLPDKAIQPWIFQAFNAEYDFFVKRAHLPTSMGTFPIDEGLTERFEAFERAFHSLVCPYFSSKEELDDILQATNSTTD